MRRHPDVFVVGGGPAGLALAVAARRKGMRVTVADGARPPIDKACGEGLMPDGLAALRSLGFSLAHAEAFPFRGIRFLGQDVAVEADFPGGQGLGIRRTTLHSAMVEQAADAGVEMLWQCPVEGISEQGVTIRGELTPCKWIVGADGGNSRVRRWAKLDASHRDERRFGFRRHYRVAPWTDCMEVYWGDGCQVYVTPVAPSEVCVAVISGIQHRLDDALSQFPRLAARLDAQPHTTIERGSITSSRRLKEVYRGRVVLVGDASGSVDAITGEGLSLVFRQAATLAECLAAGDLEKYQSEHRRIARRPSFMSDFMLAMGNRTRLRGRALRALASKPQLFAGILAMHVGRLSPLGFAANALALGWRMLTV